MEPNAPDNAVERRWRFIQHALFMCDRAPEDGPAHLDLLGDLLLVALEHDEPVLRAHVHACMAVPVDDWEAVRRDLAPLLLDPTEVCAGCGTSRAVAHSIQQVCAAYILGVGQSFAVKSCVTTQRGLGRCQRGYAWQWR